MKLLNLRQIVIDCMIGKINNNNCEIGIEILILGMIKWLIAYGN